MPYIVIALSAIVILLAYINYRSWLLLQDKSMQKYAFSLRTDLEHAGRLMKDQDNVLTQLGELFDHAGVALENTNTTSADDLKLLGSILRQRVIYSYSHPFNIEWAHDQLAELGERYGIEPNGKYSIYNLIRIAEEIIEASLVANPVKTFQMPTQPKQLGNQ